MTEQDIEAIIGEPSSEYRRTRHWGGVTSPGLVETLLRESGLPYADLPTKFGEKARDGRNVIMRQWWGTTYAIDVAFDENGAAIGVYLMRLKAVNWN